MAAYLTEVRVVFIFRRSAMICAPSDINWLPDKLRTSAKSVCQRLLTVEKRACGGALEIFERRVGLEGLSERLCALWTDAVIEKTVNSAKSRCQRLLTEG